jgi:hypothetical protein
MRTGSRRWAYLREICLAAMVIALSFLSFAHVPVSAADGFRATPDSWCGDPLAPAPADHAPCHACRIGNGADLPPPPATIEPVAFIVVPVAYLLVPGPVELPVHAQLAQPRGPPPIA